MGRGSSIGAVIVVIWLTIGVIAAGQRGYFGHPNDNCAEVGTVLVTFMAGPLNYLGLNPKINCRASRP
jgi:hypothetical protein